MLRRAISPTITTAAKIWRLLSDRALALLLIVIVLVCSGVLSAYSVLTHEEIVDLLWTDEIKPLLLQKYKARGRVLEFCQRSCDTCRRLALLRDWRSVTRLHKLRICISRASTPLWINTGLFSKRCAPTPSSFPIVICIAATS